MIWRKGQTPRYGLRIFFSIFTWLAVTISTPLNTPLKLKGPARHWLNSLPENSIGSWEDLEDACRDNFQGTYVRPPDADDLSHIVQQPGESARKLWTRFLIKRTKSSTVRMPKPLRPLNIASATNGSPDTSVRKSRSLWQLLPHS